MARPPTFLTSAASLAALALVAGCASAPAQPLVPPVPIVELEARGAADPRPASVLPDGDLSTTPPNPDPRVGLAPGQTDAGEAYWNLALLSNTPSAEGFIGVTNSDLAFSGNLVFQGNYNGFMVWDVTNPTTPTLVTRYLCPASQSDVSVYRNLLFISGEGQGGRIDCGTEGIPREVAVSPDRLRGIRIFDITDVRDPQYVANVQTCRGSHTHTVVTPPGDPDHVYIYVSGHSSVRSPEELPGCSNLAPSEDPNSSLFKIEVIKVPLANPEAAHIVTQPEIFEDLVAPPRRDAEGNVTQDVSRPGPNQCHDITVYPEVGLAGGACAGYGILLDISNPEAPRRLDAVADPNFSYWHSATFSNDGSMVLFTDEWGGGGAARCRETDRYEWGANAIFTIEGGRMVHQSYYKMPAPQTELENCVAHNGSLIPIPGREIKVQAWYQGGVSIFDWTDPANPFEIAFFDRGPYNADRLQSAGPWSTYWYNGYIYSSEISRGLDVLELLPSGFISRNEIDAAKTVIWPEFNPQEQVQMIWPPSFPLVRSYVDQLERSGGLSATRIAALRAEFERIEGLAPAGRVAPLGTLAQALNGEAQGSSDAAKVRLLAGAVRDLAGAQR
jgi:hypothetical protein